MAIVPQRTRRAILTVASTAVPHLALKSATAAHPPPPARDGKVHRVGVISAANRGKPQRTNGQTWHFAQYLHPTCDLDAVKKYLDPTRPARRDPRRERDRAGRGEVGGGEKPTCRCRELLD
jgi:hypothetical protein